MRLSCCIYTCTDSVRADPDGTELSSSGGDEDPTAFTRRGTEGAGGDRKEECWRTNVVKKKNTATDSQAQKDVGREVNQRRRSRQPDRKSGQEGRNEENKER